ncbi:MAG: ferritin-like protein [Solirubrobacteraceae bacterium]|nr:ferritin-like protein [Solirubrobacteraceae bacterium]
MSKNTPAVDVSHLHVFDTDGAIREAESGINKALSRRGLLRGAGVAAGGVAMSGLLPGSALAAGFGSKDKAILNFALTLEYLESAFYARSLEHAGLSGSLHRFAKVVAEHEKAHVAFLKQALGSSAVKRPSFDFGSATRSPSAFTATSIVLEDTGVQAYQGQAANIHSDALLAAALSVHPVEARHASWIRYLAGENPAPAAFNPSLTKSQVLAAVTGTGFIKG